MCKEALLGSALNEDAADTEETAAAAAAVAGRAA